MQDLNDKVTGNTLTAAEWNEIPSEIQNAIESLGITLSGADLSQLVKAIAGYASHGDFYADSGAANAYVLSATGAKIAPPDYADGFRARFKVGNTNTAASTVNINSIGVKGLADIAGGALTAGDLVSGQFVRIAYNLSDDRFELQSDTLEIATKSDMETATDLTKAVTPGRVVDSPSSSKAWVNFNGTGVVSINDSINVSSITDNGVGDYTVNLSTSFAAADYAITATSIRANEQIDSQAAGSFQVVTSDDAGTNQDASRVSAVAHGEQ